MIPVAPVSSIRSLSSSTFPLPRYNPGETDSLFCMSLPTVTAPAVSASSSSSSIDETVSSFSLYSTATRTTRSCSRLISISSPINTSWHPVPPKESQNGIFDSITSIFHNQPKSKFLFINYCFFRVDYIGKIWYNGQKYDRTQVKTLLFYGGLYINADK